MRIERKLQILIATVFVGGAVASAWMTRPVLIAPKTKRANPCPPNCVDGNRNLIAPNVMHRIAPPPISGIEPREGMDKYLYAATESRLSERDLEIRGHPIVLDQVDQRTIANTQMRGIYNVKEH